MLKLEQSLFSDDEVPVPTIDIDYYDTTKVYMTYQYWALLTHVLVGWREGSIHNNNNISMLLCFESAHHL